VILFDGHITVSVLKKRNQEMKQWLWIANIGYIAKRSHPLLAVKEKGKGCGIKGCFILDSVF